MRAIQQTEFGGPEVLKLVEVADPKPMGGEILVRVTATGLNPVDGAVRSGRFPLLGQPPFILGWDISGVVEAVNGVNRLAVGDEVFGMALFPRAASGYAELVAAPSRNFVRKPKAWTHEQAAAVPLAGLTAWQGLIEGARLAAGDRVLVHGAGGGVGHLAVQLAKAHGATVVATASAGKVAFVRELGADWVIDYAQERFEEVVGPVDIVFETVSGNNGLRSLALLGPGGRFVTIVDRANPALSEGARNRGASFVGVGVEPDYVALEAMALLGEAGRLTPVVAQSFSLDRAAEAHVALSQRPAGKIVLTV